MHLRGCVVLEARGSEVLRINNVRLYCSYTYLRVSVETVYIRSSLIIISARSRSSIS